jgi:hypothetical protein
LYLVDSDHTLSLVPSIAGGAGAAGKLASIKAVVVVVVAAEALPARIINRATNTKKINLLSITVLLEKLEHYFFIFSFFGHTPKNFFCFF